MVETVNVFVYLFIFAKFVSIYQLVRLHTCESRGQAAAHDRDQASDAIGLTVLRLLLRQLHKSHTARERYH
jgi:hypothetical protein